MTFKICIIGFWWLFALGQTALCQTTQAQPDTLAGSAEPSVVLSGSVVYALEYVSKRGRADSQRLNREMGDELSITYHGGAWHMKLNGSLRTELWLNPEQARMYVRRDNAPSLAYYSVAADPRGVASVEETDSTLTVLGRQCKMLRIELADGSRIYYFYHPETLRINPELFGQFRLGGFDMYAEIARALPLKYVFDGPRYRETRVATSASEGPVPLSLLQMPELPSHHVGQSRNSRMQK